MSLLAQIGSNEQVLTTNLVVGETWTFLRRKDTHQSAIAFLDRVKILESRNKLSVHHVTSEQETRAWTWLRRRDERIYSFVDASSFEVMRERRLREAFAFGPRFRSCGIHRTSTLALTSTGQSHTLFALRNSFATSAMGRKQTRSWAAMCSMRRSSMSMRLPLPDALGMHGEHEHALAQLVGDVIELGRPDVVDLCWRPQTLLVGPLTAEVWPVVEGPVEGQLDEIDLRTELVRAVGFGDVACSAPCRREVVGGHRRVVGEAVFEQQFDPAVAEISTRDAMTYRRGCR